MVHPARSHGHERHVLCQQMHHNRQSLPAERQQKQHNCQSVPVVQQQKRPGSLLWHQGAAAKKRCCGWTREHQQEGPATATILRDSTNLLNPSTPGRTAGGDGGDGRLKGPAACHIMLHAAVFPGCVGPVVHTGETPTRSNGCLLTSVNQLAEARHGGVSGDVPGGKECAFFSAVSPPFSSAVLPTALPASSPTVSRAVSPAILPAVSPTIPLAPTRPLDLYVPPPPLPRSPPPPPPYSPPPLLSSSPPSPSRLPSPPSSYPLPLAPSPLPPAPALALASARHRPATPMHWMVFKNASAAGAADDSVGPKDLCSPITLLNRHYQHCHLHHHDKAPVKPRVTEEATLLPTSTTSTSSRTSAASAASNGSASNLNDEECIPWCSDGASQSPSSHCWGSETTAQKAGCATWQPEAAIQGLKHAAVFPFSFGPEAVTGDTAPSMNKHIPFTHVPVSHGCAVVRQPLNHPSSPYNVPSFAGLLNSISPARQLHRRVVPAPATSAVCSSCNHSVSPSLQGKEALLPPEAHAQPQEQEQSDTCTVCSASLSGKTCVLNSPSMGSCCSQHEKQEKQKRQEMRERRVQGLVVTGDVLPGLHDGQWQSAAGSGNGTVSGNPMEGSVDEEDLEELQDTASS
ncbi:unnamed protein product [Closterium sp. Naga37s-1]|nr:unnamed protein product [Closterium sp. Naga37s-1]